MLNFHICDFFTKMLDLLSFKYLFSGRDLYKSKNYVRNSQNVMIYILNSGFRNVIFSQKKKWTFLYIKKKHKNISRMEIKVFKEM